MLGRRLQQIDVCSPCKKGKFGEAEPSWRNGQLQAVATCKAGPRPGGGGGGEWGDKKATHTPCKLTVSAPARGRSIAGALRTVGPEVAVARPLPPCRGLGRVAPGVPSSLGILPSQEKGNKKHPRLGSALPPPRPLVSLVWR